MEVVVVVLVVMVQLLLAAACICCMGGRATFGNVQSINNNSSSSPISTIIQSEDGDVIECVDLQKQPAFDHPALRNHTIQMAPTGFHHHRHHHDDDKWSRRPSKQQPLATQGWRRSGSCPQGTIPLRRSKTTASSRGQGLQIDGTQDTSFNTLSMNRSRAVMVTGGYSYSGVKGDIKVGNPHVEDDDYSLSHVSLVSGARLDFENIRSGWAVNPRLYGDRQTRLFVYWTVDGSNTTGCFDLTCPGFVQTSSEIALGSPINPISLPSSLSYEIIIYIFKDPVTGNWWVEYGEEVYLGYWPSQLFTLLAAGNAQSAEWGGEVHSTNLGEKGRSPHTSTGMGNGKYPDPIGGTSGWVKKIRVRENSVELRFPEWVNIFSDEFNCYDTFFVMDYVPDPEFYYGGPGRSLKCP